MTRLKISLVALLGIITGLIIFLLISVDFKIETKQQIITLVSYLLILVSILFGILTINANKKKITK